MTQSDAEPAELALFPFERPDGVYADAEYARLRAEDAVPAVRLASGGRVYLATRYADVRRVFTDPVFSRAAAADPGAVVLTHTSTIPHVMLNMDPPDHSRIRRLVARAFTTAAAERMRPRMQAITDELIDAMLAQGAPVDFVAAFAAPLPALVISEMLGVPAADRDRLRHWVDITLSISRYTPQELQAAFGQLMGYLQELIASKRAAPAEDLVSGLIQAREEGDRLSEPELLYTVFLLIAGGYETTAGLLANSVLTLHEHPDQLALLRADPELLPGAVEELLRYVPISWCTLERITLEDVELGGVPVPAGSAVVPVQYSANRDPALVSGPDRLDLTRPPSAHLAFGHGVHRCIGAALARLELQIAYASLLRRLPLLHPAVPKSALQWKTGVLNVGPVALPVAW
jgi:cytochrome P450